MLIVDLISQEFKPVKLSYTVERALQILDGFKVTHVPLIEGTTYIGCLSEALLNRLPLDEKLQVAKNQLEFFFITEQSTVFDSINVFYTHNTNMIPVLSNDEHYLGHITIEDVVGVVSKLPLVGEPAAMITIGAPLQKMSMVEIAKIVEANNGKIFGMFISKMDESDAEITVKYSAENLTSVSETFERFGYVILRKFFIDRKVDLLEDRYNQFMKYLEM
ncbi:MAG: CBS domain-containing protein [Weeksellaceae bacterium]|nr:CBS domain-containing protein [Weeksellaceae bacterium]